MLKAIREKFHRLFISPDMPPEGYIFNVMLAFGFVGSFAGFLVTLATAASFLSMLATFLLSMSILLMMLLINKIRDYRLGGFLVSAVFCDIGFPFVFFTSGGIYSGMLAYLLLGSVIISLLLEGKDFVLMLALYLAINTVCFFAQMTALIPVRPIVSEYMLYVDITASFVIASVMIGIVLKYQKREYVKAQREAEDASRAKSEFLSNMSHEMRTPMNAIIGMTNIAKVSADIERKDYCLKKIEDASSHLLGVINDILDMSKIEANKLELSPVSFNFEKMIRKITGVVSFRMDEKKQRFTLRIDERIPPVLFGDDQRLSQVVTNLLSNAIKFTPENGSIELKTRLINEENQVCTIEVEVVDSGIGIDKEQLTRLFTSFEQADSGTSRRFGGTGLGLAISKNIVEMMGGKIRVESELGKGSAFIFSFRVKRVPESQYADVPEGRSAESPLFRNETRLDPNDSLKNHRVLLVEDIEINREIMIALLEPASLQIDCAENGAEALRIFTESPGTYDLIFMDIQMPEMDGYEATRRIRAWEKEHQAEHPHGIPIIAMTANVFREDVEKCQEAGMNGHVGKPLDFDEVLRTLRQYLADS
ncbi:MAG: response regulator [Gracilibacteraceae bacterium]|jgi:signal transduction histidine kinase/CheY-like chemotaxis protein|nr:response regulator [Gracilibacteraceae bacterium]